MLVAPAPRGGLVRLTWMSRVTLVLTAVAGLAAFAWPLIIPPTWDLPATQAPLVFAVVLPFVLAVVLSELGSSGMDAKSLAMLGVMTAVGAALRPLGAGTAGLELVFFPMIVAGRVFGPGFGFAMGNLSLFASAILTGGVGPWLPYQMVASGFVGFFAGLLPPAGRRWELVLLGAYGALASFAYGWLMDFAFWPFGVGSHTQFSFDPAAGALENIHTFVLYNIATSMGWNLGRAVTTVLMIAVMGGPLLSILRRSVRKAHFVPATG
ncbi:ECF transporter S component [Propionicicella superfundia]|uniref:ECF transporter S component n=1 Tax=Propionicicella superfundia TaxID=348582 RepID=UPI00056BA94A|nr:ECF transporter S component [Propionicicella superfundia]